MMTEMNEGAKMVPQHEMPHDINGMTTKGFEGRKKTKQKKNNTSVNIGTQWKSTVLNVESHGVSNVNN